MAGLVDISIKNFKDILNDKEKLDKYLKFKCGRAGDFIKRN